MAFWNTKKTTKEMVEEVRVAGPTEPELDVVEEEKPVDTQPKVQEPAKKPEREWMWVEGYKAVYSDMTAQKGNIVYEVDKVYEMPKEDVKECSGGYHLCRRLKDTFNYYSPFTDKDKGVRYYKVKALVPKDRWDILPEKDTDICQKEEMTAYSPYIGKHTYKLDIDKIAACSIVLTEEVELEQILGTITKYWSNSYIARYPEHAKEFYLTHDFNQDAAKDFYAYILEVECGFSTEMTKYIVKQGLDQAALAFGTQPELSMKEKLQFIFNRTVD